jgi:hypothetical protein
MRKAAATGRSQVVTIGVAQEYQRVFTEVGAPLDAAFVSRSLVHMVEDACPNATGRFPSRSV